MSFAEVQKHVAVLQRAGLVGKERSGREPLVQTDIETIRLASELLEEHDLTPGGDVKYYMTGPEGDSHWGWWKVESVDAPNRLEFEDGFADDEGEPNPDTPTTVSLVEIVEQPNGRARMTITTQFPSLEAMEQMVAMGMEEGITAALGQIDDLLLTGSAA